MRTLIDYFGELKANIFFSFTAMVMTIVILEMVLGSTLVTGQTIILAMSISMIQSFLQIIVFKDTTIKYGARVSKFLIILFVLFVASAVFYKWINASSEYQWMLFAALFLACSVAATLGMAGYERLKLNKN